MIGRMVTVAAIALFLSYSVSCAEEWRELKSEHFIVYYFDGENFAREVSQWAEKYYDNIASDLGYARYDNFWTWDKRVKIFLYRSREEYLRSTSAQNWSYGFANYYKKEIVSYANSAKFIDTLLPHEITHLVFRDFVGFKGEVPIWLDEGVAQWEEAGKRKASAEMMKALIARGEIIPLEQLMRMDVSRESNESATNRFYIEAITLVGFMIREYGESKFTLFCRQLRDGATVNKALEFTYSDSMRNIDELEKKWIEYYKRG
ncbi:MAG: peptidase MA family metallohydrolase [Candidatus Omnitrophica bacterium]|nr:peptidase MA family metallohydrolase [Candidatus Omnitrophota bacterium]